MDFFLKGVAIALFLFGTLGGFALLLLGGIVLLWSFDPGSSTQWDPRVLLPVSGLLGILVVSYTLGVYLWRRSNKNQ